MSIFGERIRRPGPDIGTILSDYAKKQYVDAQDSTISEVLKHFKAQLVSDLSEYVKKDYVDAQDALRVLKAGDTMTGDLDMGGKLVRGLPKDLRDYEGDEATSWNQVTKKVAMRKPLIAVWAEQTGPLTAGKREWSFGDGSNRSPPYYNGYSMPASGRILRISINIATSGRHVTPAAKVRIMINGAPTSYFVSKPNGSSSFSVIFGTPLKVRGASVIDFKTETSSSEIKGATVSLLIELDL